MELNEFILTVIKFLIPLGVGFIAGCKYESQKWRSVGFKEGVIVHSSELYQVKYIKNVEDVTIADNKIVVK
jgi:hypothetical protein